LRFHFFDVIKFCNCIVQKQLTVHAVHMISLFQKCLDKDPAKRWSCEQLLQHPFFDRHSFKKPVYRIARERDREAELAAVRVSEQWMKGS
jgi:serine/threonine protein kinase